MRLHPLLELIGAPLLPAGLQGRVMLPHDQRAMIVLGFDALVPQRTSGAGGNVPFKTVSDPPGGLLLKVAALGVLLPSRTSRSTPFHLDPKTAPGYWMRNFRTIRSQ
jgi:hypothetical protein